MDACEPARDVCATLDRKLAHVLETRMRVALVREQVVGSPTAEACAWLAEALDRSPGTGAVDPLRDAVVEVLTGGSVAPAPGGVEPLPYDVRRDLYACAVEAGADRLAALLRSQPVGEDGESGGPRLPADVAEIPLGMRRTLAKGADPLLLEKLALDPDPTVIANLLRNPRLCERDVIRIAAMRPAPASTLEEVARSPRWSIRPRVRAALVRNPHCPVALAVKLLGRIPLVDLRTMRHDPDLPEPTRTQLELELTRRSPPTHEPD
jgi:hypothetical protein